ncbi:MAG TPA: FxLYD domain-containing protein [Thermoanaerobaculia bacterium]
MRRAWSAAARRLALPAVLTGLIAGPAAADWLVTREGQRVETRGAWQVKGKLVVFRAARGELSSLRLAEVDLEASRRATDEAERARQAAEEARRRGPEKKAPVLVLTDDKVRHVEPAGPAALTPAREAPKLAVSWERSADPQDGHVVITGALRNDASADATEITLSVQLLDASGNAAATGQAELTATALSPGQQSGFRVEFPGVSSFTDVKFDPKALAAASDNESEPQPASPGGG